MADLVSLLLITISISLPNRFSTWTANDMDVPVVFSTVDIPENTLLTISLYENVGVIQPPQFIMHLVQGFPNPSDQGGTFLWPLVSNIPTSSDVFVRITVEDTDEYADSAVFTTVNEKIVVEDPIRNTVWYTNDNGNDDDYDYYYNISWSTMNIPNDDTLSISLTYDGGESSLLLSDNVMSGDGQFAFSFANYPSNIFYSRSDYTIVVTWNNNTIVTTQSPQFTITNTSLMLLKPSLSSLWRVNSSALVSWNTSINDPSLMLQIDLYRASLLGFSNEFVATIATNVPLLSSNSISTGTGVSENENEKLPIITTTASSSYNEYSFIVEEIPGNALTDYYYIVIFVTSNNAITDISVDFGILNQTSPDTVNLFILSPTIAPFVAMVGNTSTTTVDLTCADTFFIRMILTDKKITVNAGVTKFVVTNPSFGFCIFWLISSLFGVALCGYFYLQMVKMSNITKMPMVLALPRIIRRFIPNQNNSDSEYNNKFTLVPAAVNKKSRYCVQCGKVENTCNCPK